MLNEPEDCKSVHDRSDGSDAELDISESDDDDHDDDNDDSSVGRLNYPNCNVSSNFLRASSSAYSSTLSCLIGEHFLSEGDLSFNNYEQEDTSNDHFITLDNFTAGECFNTSLL